MFVETGYQLPIDKKAYAKFDLTGVTMKPKNPPLPIGENHMSDFYTLTPEQQVEHLHVLATKALVQWDITDADLQLADLRENAVFRVSLDGEARFALRVHRYGYHNDAALNSELVWIRALEQHGIDVPQVVPTRANHLFIRVESDAVPEPRQVDLFEWIEGEQLGAATEDLEDDAAFARIYFSVGEITARLHNQTVMWTPPAGFVRHAWDIEGLTGEQPVWGRFWEHPALSQSEKTLTLRARSRIRADLIKFGVADDTYSLIHSDILPENVLVQGERLRVIDFDDAGFGWHLYDIATTLADYRGEGKAQLKREALVEGYRSHRALSDEHIGQLDLFALARGLTTLGWLSTRAETENAQTVGRETIDTICQLAEDYLAT